MGRAVTMEDLEALYQMDLKLLGSIEAGLNNKIGSMREIIMARYVQKAWRGFCARKRVKALREKRRAFLEKYNLFCKKMKGKREVRAVNTIARRWREYALNKEKKQAATKAQLEKQMEEKRKLLEALSEQELKRLEWAALVLQKNWRAYKARKEFNKTHGSSAMAASRGASAMSASKGSSMRFGQ